MLARTLSRAHNSWQQRFNSVAKTIHFAHLVILFHSSAVRHHLWSRDCNPNLFPSPHSSALRHHLWSRDCNPNLFPIPHSSAVRHHLWSRDCNPNLFPTPHSSAVRHHLWSRDDHHPADDERNGQVPRHAQQCQGIHETTRGKLHAYCLLYSVPYVYTA